MTIHNEQEYDAAIKEIETYYTADNNWGNTEDPRYEELFSAIEAYEDIHYPIEPIEGSDEELLDLIENGGVLPIDEGLVNRIKDLTEGVEVNLNEPIEGPVELDDE